MSKQHASDSSAIPTPSSPPSPPAPPSLGQLFRAYLLLGATGFGGTLVWLRRLFVEEKAWIAADEFNDALSLGQFLPGPNVFNVIVVLGRHFHGLPGMAVAVLGIMCMPLCYAIVAVLLYQRFGDLAVVQNIMHGVGPVAAGLMLSLAVKTAAAPALRSALALVVVGTFCAVVIYHLSLPLVLLIMGPSGMLLAAGHEWRQRRRQRGSTT